MEKVGFEAMSDERVLEKVAVLVGRSNETTAELLAYLGEVDRRGLHLGQACSSLFVFCVERLHMSESAAGKRITAARVARRFPVVLEMIARGEIHLTTVNMLAAHLTEANHAEVLARARHRRKREVEKLVAELAPRPDAPARVIALPRARAAEGGERAPDRVADGGERAPERVVDSGGRAPERVADGGERAPERAAAAEKRRPAVVAALAPRRYEIRVTVDEETHERLVRLQDLLAHQVPDRDPAAIISRALEVLLERTLARKAAVADRPRAARATGTRTRHIPAAVRRAVWERDQGQCAFRDQSGRRCSATGRLEFHHLRNWARGAAHAVDEIELRCRGHNQYQAVLDYGAELIAARRGERSRAEERRGPCRVGGQRGLAGPAG